MVTRPAAKAAGFLLVPLKAFTTETQTHRERTNNAVSSCVSVALW